MTTVQWLLHKLGLIEPQSCRVARAQLRERYPGFLPRDARLLASESDRCVVAVFYQEPDKITRPMKYKLFGVSPDLTIVTELPCTPESPYWIRDRK
jgi:hypothetical protein